VQYLDGYVLVNEVGTQRFWWSALLDAGTWPALNFSAADARPDLLTTLFVDHREIYLLGTQSTEIWQSTGNSLAPFARSSAIFLEQGCEARNSVAALDNTLFFLGGSPRGEGPVWNLRGYEPTRISTHATETALSQSFALADSIAFTVRHGGHAWFCLYVADLDTTWIFDRATSAWMELAELLDDGTLAPYRCWTHCLAFGDHLWGDRGSGALYVWSADWYYYGDKPIYRERTAPHVRNDQQPVVYSTFEVVMETGIGLDGSPPVGADPQVMMQYSDDGGRAWSYPLWRSAGPIGARTRLVRWRRLGRSKSNRCFRIVITDPVFVAILGARLEVSSTTP
jgi:hypothetical protein